MNLKRDKCIIDNYAVYYRAVFIVFMSLISITLHAELRFKHLSINQQLSSNFVNTIVKDADGFIWIGTESGLNRYDGYEVTRYFKNLGDSTGISGNSIFAIYIDRDGRFWIGTNHGISIFDKRSGQFDPIDKKERQFNSYYVRDIDRMNDDQIVVTSPKGILLYNEKTLERSVLLDFSTSDIEIDGEVFSQACVNDDQKIWAFTQNAIYVIDPTNLKSIERIAHSCGIVRNVKKHNPNLLMTATENGLFQIDTKAKRIEQYSIPGQDSKLTCQELWDFCFDQFDNLWLATTIDGLYQYNFKSKVLRKFESDRNQELSLNNNSIRSLLVDNDGIIWAGTQHGGVNFAYINNPKKFKVFSEFSDPNMASTIYSAVQQDSNGDFWMGTDGDGLFVYHSKTSTYEHFKVGLKGSDFMTSNSILAVREDQKRNVWVVGYRSSIVSYNLDTKRWTTHSVKCEMEPCDGKHRFRHVFIDSRGRVWFSTNHRGVIMYDGKTFKNFNTNNSALIDNYVLCVSERVPNEIWVGTYNGACILDTEQPQQKRHFRHDVKNSKSITNDWIYSFYLDSKNRFWIGTSEGLNLYHPDEATFSAYGFEAGFASEVFYGILEDSNGKLWMSTSNGLICFDADKNQVSNYFQNDGLPSNEFHQASCFKAHDGQLYFGSNNGLLFFDPNEIQVDTIKPNTVISGVQVFFENINVQEYQSKRNPNKLVFKHWQSTISIAYAGVNFVNNADNHYSYMLEGYDDKWIDVGSRREVNFTNLDPGDYTFKVRCVNKDGIESEHIAQFNFEIQTPWWRSFWFRAAVVFLLLSISFLIFKYRVNSIQRQERKIKKLLEERTSELFQKNNELMLKTNQLDDMNALLIVQQKRLEEQTNELTDSNKRLNDLNRTKDRFFSVVAHDLKNPFNSILGLSSILADSEYDLDEAYRNKVARLINRSAQDVYNLLENLLLWSSSQLHRVEALKTHFDLLRSIHKVNELVQPYSQTKDVLISVFCKLRTVEVYADENMIDAVLRNLITNAIKFSKSGGRIEIVCWIEEANAVCSVRDYGVGMTPDQLESLMNMENTISTKGTNGEKGTGLGLIICHEFIEKNSGRFWSESQPNVGTTFYFSLPLA